MVVRVLGRGTHKQENQTSTKHKTSADAGERQKVWAFSRQSPGRKKKGDWLFQLLTSASFFFHG
jgi:hypothetical protein